MELVNQLGNTLNRGSAFGDHPSSSSEAGGSRGNVKTASDISSAILEIFKCSLAEVESYLTSCEARLKLEEDYVRGLRALTDKSKESLIKLDSRIASCMYIEPGGAELPKARQAWKMLRENQLREIDARLHYIETLRQGVIAPLTVYRDAQERIRKRVKEDLKTSIGRYDEMRHVTLPRARKTYEKRCDEVEQMRLQQQAIEDQRTLLSTSGAGMSREPSSQSAAREQSSPTLSSLISDGQEDHTANSPTSLDATSPQRSHSAHLHPSHARKGSGANSDAGKSSSATSSGPSPSMSGDAALYASPTSNEKKGHFLDALRSRENWEAARKEAPKKLNALLSRMRDGGEKGAEGSLSASPPGEGGLGISLGGGTGSIKNSHNIALKSVKAKREAEDADQAYRKSIFNLETLRLRREKTISAALASVIESRRELYLTCQAVWQQSERSSQVLNNEQLSMSVMAGEVLETSLDTLDDELRRVESRVPSLAELDEGKVPYVNYYFGECKDLIFGVSLIDYAFSRAQYLAPTLGPSKVEAPLIVRKCIAFIEQRALSQAGIYRISAKHTAIQNLAHSLERDEEKFQFSSQDDPATVAGVLKLYLRQLPEAILPIPFEERVRYTHERQEQIQSGFAALKSRIRRLPAINQATLKTIIEHLAKLAKYAEQNKMNVSNLSIVFGPLLLSQADHETTSIAAAMEEDRVTEDLILYCDVIFDLSRAGAPVLPPIQSSSSRTEESEVDLEQTPTVAQQPHAQASSGDATKYDPDRPLAHIRGESTSLKRSNAIMPTSVAAAALIPPNAAVETPQVAVTEEQAQSNNWKREVTVQHIDEDVVAVHEAAPIPEPGQEASSAPNGDAVNRTHAIVPPAATDSLTMAPEKNSLAEASAQSMYEP